MWKGKQLTHAQTDEPEINGGDMKSLRGAASDDVEGPRINYLFA